MTLRITMLIATGALIACAAAAGCSDHSAMNEFFPQESRAPHAFADAHAQAGARSDATLQPHHFDGDELNSLGREKLDNVLAARGSDAEATTTVYLNLGDRADAQARRSTASVYLREQGLSENQFKLVDGSNPNLTSPAAGHISRMDRTEGQATESTGTVGESTPGYKPDPMTK